MEEREQRLQEAKQACRLEKRKTVRLWQWITAGCLVAALILTPVTTALGTQSDTLAVLYAPKDQQVVYYPAGYEDGQAYAQAGEELFSQLARESAVLVKNDAILPFAEDMLLTCAADETVQAQTLQEALGQKTVGETEAAVVICGKSELTEEQKTLLQQSDIPTVLVLLGGETKQLLAQTADACLWLPQPDAAAAEALLWGQATPCGRLPVTIGTGMPDNAGIYTDYRFYETRYEDHVYGKTSGFDYAQQVQYSFGYGLSYTGFTYSEMVTEESADSFTVSVTVTNTGSCAGKEVVQIYAQSPYTQYDTENRVEKPAVILAGFAKTQLLEPQQSQRVQITVEKRQIASYDASGEGAYILEAGDYYLCVAANAHAATNQILSAKGSTPETTEGRMDTAADAGLVYAWNCPETRTDLCEAANIYVPATAQTSVSRQNWAEVTAEQELPALNSSQEWEAVLPAITGADNHMGLWQMVGLAWDDPYWEGLLDQLRPYELKLLACNSSRVIKPARSQSVLPDGQTLAASFDELLAQDMGAWAAEQWLTNGFVYESRLREPVGDSYLLGSLLGKQAQAMLQKGVRVIAQSAQPSFTNEQVMRETEQKALQLLLEQGAGLQTEQQAILRLAQQWNEKSMILTRDQQTEQDLRQAAKRTLYALVNSSAMNGIGQDTKPIAQQWQLQRVTLTAAIVCVLLAAAGGVCWLFGWRRLRLTQAYLDYKTVKKTIREEKKNEETAPQ